MEIDSFGQDYEKRFEFFKNKIWGKLQIKEIPKTVIFVNSYFEFIKLRNYFKYELIFVFYFKLTIFNKEKQMHKFK